MRKALRWAGFGLAGLLALLLIAALAIFAISETALRKKHEAQAERLQAPDTARLAEAPQMAAVHGCTSCHGAGLAGKMMDIPAFVARAIAPNLPAIAAKASDQQLAAAIRQGIGHDGRALYIMPSAQYSRLTDAEVATLVAWIRSLPAVPGLAGKVKPGPMGRIGMVFGSFGSVRELVPVYRAQLPVAIAGHEPGRHLAATACAECHGPALAGQDNPFGPAPDLAVAAGYDLAQFTALMRRGVTPGGNKLGLMGEVARDDFVHLRDEQIAALHAYLTARAKLSGG
jgi:cytochrome c553